MCGKASPFDNLLFFNLRLRLVPAPDQTQNFKSEIRKGRAFPHIRRQSRTPYLRTSSKTVTRTAEFVTAFIRITAGCGALLSSHRPLVVATFSVSVSDWPNVLLATTLTSALVAS